MKIKDLRQFRTFFKKEIREIESSNRNEHFIGVRKEVEGKSVYGFFEICHCAKEGYGDSDGIRGFLEVFFCACLDNDTACRSLAKYLF